MYIYVLDKNGKALMPTSRAGRVRHLLHDGQAEIVSYTPFTIKLKYDVPGFVQPITLGCDTGSIHIGLSAVTNNKEIYTAEVTLRTNIVELLSTRRELRRSRRGRLRYRKPRFDNRVATKKDGWIAPSVKYKVDSNIRAILRVLKILPVSEVIIEVAQFDTQKIKNPEIQGKEYQEGEQLGFWNVREYVLARDGHKCQACKGKSKDKILNVHHIESRKTGGDSHGNLITLCETCHKKYHNGELSNFKPKRSTSLRDAAAMGIMRWKVYDELNKILDVPIKITYGYKTKYTRINNGLEKSHCIDALCISGHPKAQRLNCLYMYKQIRRHNRQINRSNKLKGGILKRNQAPREVFGFRRYDVVKIGGEEAFINARRIRGCFVVKKHSGETISNSLYYKHLNFIRHSDGFVFNIVKF